jgi:hypothetical protein
MVFFQEAISLEVDNEMHFYWINSLAVHLMVKICNRDIYCFETLVGNDELIVLVCSKKLSSNNY